MPKLSILLPKNGSSVSSEDGLLLVGLENVAAHPDG